MKICSLSKSMEWLIQLQLTAPYSKELPDYPTKHCKPILSVVSVTSISLILLQKVIPRHKKWRRLPALPEVSIWINTAVGSQEIRLFLEAASCSQGTLTSTRGRCRLHPTQPQPYTSAWHFIVSVSKNRRDKQLMPLSFHWMHLSVTAATLQRMPGQRALALLALLKILARSCGQILLIHTFPEKMYRQSRITTLPSICWDTSKSLLFPEGIKTGALSLQSSLS